MVLLCKVCNRPIDKYSYRGILCNNCRSFYHRRVALKQAPICKYMKNCEITFRNSTNCTACRFKKCTMTGVDMRRGKNSSSRNVVPHVMPNIFSYEWGSIASFHVSLGPRLISQLNGCQNASDFASLCLQYETFINCWDGPSPSVAEVNLDISLKDLLSNPLLCTKRDTVSLLLGHYKEDQAAIDQMTTPSSDPNFVYYTHRSFGRNVTCQVDLLMGLKEFYELDQSDQLKLLQYSNPLSKIFLLIYVKFCYRQDIAFLMNFLCKQFIEGTSGNFWLTTKKAIFDTGSNIVERIFYEEQLDHREAVLLRIILLLQSPENFSDEGRKLLRSARTRYISILSGLIHETHSSWTEKQQISRIHNLLSTIQAFKELGEMFRKALLVLCANNLGRMGHRLPVEMLLKEF